MLQSCEISPERPTGYRTQELRSPGLNRTSSRLQRPGPAWVPSVLVSHVRLYSVGGGQLASADGLRHGRRAKMNEPTCDGGTCQHVTRPTDLPGHPTALVDMSRLVDQDLTHTRSERLHVTRFWGKVKEGGGGVVNWHLHQRLHNVVKTSNNVSSRRSRNLPAQAEMTSYSTDNNIVQCPSFCLR